MQTKLDTNSERAHLSRRQKGLRFIGLSAFAISGTLALIGLAGGFIAPVLLVGAIFTWRASYWQGWLDATREEASA